MLLARCNISTDGSARSKCRRQARGGLAVGVLVFGVCSCAPTSEVARGAQASASRECCSWFERQIDRVLPGDASFPNTLTKIEWIVKERPDVALRLGDLAFEQIQRRQNSDGSRPDYDLIVVGGGPFSAVIACNIVGQAMVDDTECGGSPRRILVISRDLGGPFFRFGRTFYLNTRERLGDPGFSETPLTGCPLQVYPFVAPLSGDEASFRSLRATFGQHTYLYAEAKLLGDVILLNQMLSGVDFVIGEDVSQGGIALGASRDVFEVSVGKRAFRGRKVVVATGHGEPIVPEGLRAILDSERAEQDPKVMVLDEFLRRAEEQAAKGENPLAHHSGELVGIAGGSDGGSILAEYVLGKAPPRGYGFTQSAAPLRLATTVTPPKRLIQFGQPYATGAQFRSQFSDELKVLRYDDVAKALDQGVIEPIADRVTGAEKTPRGKVRTLYGATSTQAREVDRLLVAVGYDPDAAYRLVASGDCAPGLQYEVLYDDLSIAPKDASSADRIAEIPTCDGKVIPNLSFFIPRGLVDKPSRRGFALARRAAKLAGHLFSN